jgi:hypothetical protein
LFVFLDILFALFFLCVSFHLHTLYLQPSPHSLKIAFAFF